MSAAQGTQRATVSVLPLAAGACGACAQSVYALLAPRFSADLEARGITFTRNPRFADVVLVTGVMTEQGRAAITAVLDSVPQPRAIVAVGSCAIDGDVFRGSPALVASVADELDVNVEIAGCPPAPTAILAAIVEAAQLLATSDEAETHEDQEAEDTDESGDADEEGHDA
jgi:Ni,Fe-hydrogenase III small subunit